MTEVAGKVAVVTGGASGIGRGIAEALLEQGASVAIADIEEDVLSGTVAALRLGLRPRSGDQDPGSLSERSESKGRVAGFRVDVREEASVQALHDAVLAEFGRVDVVCLNAGVGPAGRVKDLTKADWEWILGVNLWGVIHGVRAFLPTLLANADGGHLQVTGSTASFAPMTGIASYNVTKYGVRALIETLAQELEEDGSKVRVSLLAPGTVSTNIKTSSRNRPSGLEGALQDMDLEAQAREGGGPRFIKPITAGRIAVRAILADDLYAATHPDWWSIVDERQRLVEAGWRKYPVLEEGAS
ncbi:MAG: SDR family NAD(P)-dependent oxidoreductase [Microbacteriaceae bacterium]|nr:SDR family NAD(P)-dependent oxidoreductase [Microbacteriaceae bacterium]